MSMFRGGVSVFICVLLTMTHAVPADAHRAWPMVGASPGDLTVTSLCRSGDHVQGFRGRAGLWIDELQLICQTPQKVSYAAGDALGGTGGAPFEMQCKRSRHLSTIKIDLTSDGKRIKNVIFYCTAPGNPSGAEDRYALEDFVGDSKSFDECHQTPCEMLDQERFMVQQECLDESFTGMTVRFGKDVNAIGFICDPVPPQDP